MNRVLALAGIDPLQFRALTRTYLLMDFRRAGSARKAGAQEAHAPALPIAGMLVGALFNSVSIALLVFLVRDTLTAAVMMVTMAAMTVSMLLLMDFSGSVVSADDYWVVAPRPVSSRTYFAARLAAVLAYIVSFSALMSLAPAAVFMLWHGLGIGAFAGAVAATVLSGVAGAAAIIALHTWLMARIQPARLMRAISWMHIFASTVSMGGFLLVMRAFDDARFREWSLRGADWIWAMPMTWFAALVPALAGTASAGELSAAGGSVVLTVALLSVACGRMDLEFAARLSEASLSSRPSTAKRRSMPGIPGFRQGERYAVATLVAAQFRHDLRFRLAVLGILPMTAFYLVMGWSESALSDPFLGAAKPSGAPLYMALGFLPMILHGALQYSDQWKASWIFFATPSDPAALIVGAKNFVAIFFLGSYLAILAVIWSFFYDRVWHAVVHAAFIGAGAHMLLQGAVILSPFLPFAREPRKAEQSSHLVMFFMVGMIATSIGPNLLPFVYTRATWTFVLAVAMAAATVFLERKLRRRARAFTESLELA